MTVENPEVVAHFNGLTDDGYLCLMKASGTVEQTQTVLHVCATVPDTLKWADELRLRQGPGLNGAEVFRCRLLTRVMRGDTVKLTIEVE